MKHGKYTADFGKKLSQKFKGDGFEVWYDHGDPSKDSHVLKTSGYIGAELSNLTKLAEIDIMITKGDKIKCLVEIEETPVSPKKVLGNAFTICMCNGFAVNREGKHEPYRFDDETKLFIAGWFNPRGKGAEKMKQLEKRFRRCKGLDEGLPIENVFFIQAEDLNRLLGELESQISNYCSK